MKRVIFSGSRAWTDISVVQKVLSGLDRNLIVVEGGHRWEIDGMPRWDKSLDAIVNRQARMMGFDVETYWANWTRHGRGAGAMRNQRMASLPGVVEVHLFPLVDSVGTWDMSNKAAALEIPVRVWKSA